MKTLRPFSGFAVVTATLVTLGGTALAQNRRVIRGDAAATIGWLSVRTPRSLLYNDDAWQRSLFGTASLGWHWTDNLKTEADFGGSTAMRALRTDPVVVAGRQTYQTTRTTFSRRTLGLAQQYQFFHNAWFHPHAAVGAALTWEASAAESDRVFIFDTRGAEVAAAATADARRTTVTIRPFVGAGFKAYMTERGFLRSDVRVAFRGGLDEVLLRIGFGIDF